MPTTGVHTVQTKVDVNGHTFLVEPTTRRGANGLHTFEKWTKPCEHPGCKAAHRFLTREGSAPLFANPGFGVLFCAKHRPRVSLRSSVPNADRLAIMADLAAGATFSALAAAYPYPPHVLSAIARERRGSTVAKLDHAVANEIRDRHAAGENCSALAREYGVHRNSIHRILNGTTWA